MMTTVVAANPWSDRRRRAQELVERWPFAADVLTFYAALAGVQEMAWSSVRADMPRPNDAVSYAEQHVLPRVMEASVASGPQQLVYALVDRFERTHFPETAGRWLAGDEMPAVDRYLARATLAPVLEALGAAAGAVVGFTRKRSSDERRCPNCNGLPQLAYFGTSMENLVTPQRYLECERCATTWGYPRMTCAACGETETSALTIYGEEGTAAVETEGSIIRGLGAVGVSPRKNGAKVSAAQAPAAPAPAKPALRDRPTPHFPHIRIDGCTSCKQYLLTIDRARDPRAVPVVDELAAVPLDLYAKELGMRKIVPNLMGF